MKTDNITNLVFSEIDIKEDNLNKNNFTIYSLDILSEESDDDSDNKSDMNDSLSENSIDLDASLYQSNTEGGGWFTKEEQLYREKFHHANAMEKVNYVLKLNDSKAQARIKKIAIRILGRNYFDSLSAELKDEYTHYLNMIFHKEPTTSDFSDNMRINPNLLLKETRELSKKLDLSTKDKNILEQLEDMILLKIKTQQDLGF